MQVSGDIDDLVGTHKLLISESRDSTTIAHTHDVLQERHTERQTSLLVRMNGHVWDPSWEVHDVPLEEIVLAYMSQPASAGATREERS